jgi:serine/threonine-protein kinase
MKSKGLAPQLNSDTLPRLGRYVDLVLLGQGGMGAVYKGRDPDLDRKVAIKVVLDSTEDFVERFRREAKAVARLQHPNIVQVYDFGQDEAGHPYFVMELVEGRPLDQLLSERGRFSAAEVASVLSQAAAGLQAAHDAGIIHRDIKPSNLILDDKGKVKLVDFGIARLENSAMLTTPSSLLGTPTYMSPEQVAGKPVDGRTDLYSLGISCFHLLSGSPPFESREPIALALMHLNDALPSLIERAPATPPQLAALIVRMCSKDPDTRPSTAKSIVEKIDAMKNDLGGVSRPLAAVAAAVAAGPPVAVPETRAGAVAASVEQSVDAPGKKPPFMAIAAVCGVLAAGATVAAVVLLRHPSTPNPVDKPPTVAIPTPPKEPTPPTAPAAKTPTPTADNQIVLNAAHPKATGPVRVAVLKFKNVGNDKELEFLSEGIGETVLTDLSDAHKNDVAFVERNQIGSETGEIDFGQTKYVDPSTRAVLGRIAGAEMAVQGGFQKAGKTVRVTARFIHVETGEVLDTVAITKSIAHDDQLFKVQDDVAKELKDRVVTAAKKVRAP